MQASVKSCTTLVMVSNVNKPAQTTSMPAATTNGTITATRTPCKGGGGINNIRGVEQKMVKRSRRNGIINGCSVEYGCHHSPSPPPPPQSKPTFRNRTVNETKTKGAHSNEDGSSTSLGDHSQHRRLVCPNLAISYTGTLMSNRAGHLVTTQRTLESQFISLGRKLRQKQLRGVLNHARRQLHFRDTTQLDPKPSDLLGSFSSMKSDSESSESVSDIQVDSKPGPMEIEGQCKDICENLLPIQVDGASDERSTLSLDQPVIGSNNPREIPKVLYHASVTQSDKDDVFREESDISSNAASSECHTKLGEGEVGSSMRRIEQQLVGLRSLMEDDVTDSSSDEEEELDSTQMSRRENCKHSWERTRSLVGSRWAWLHHRLTTLNKELCRLEHEIQHRPNKEKFSFSRPDPPHQSPFLTLSHHSSLLEQLNKSGGNGSTPSILSSAMTSLQQKSAGKASALKPSNGYTSNHAGVPATTGNAGSGADAQYYPQLLLSDASIGAKLQVKDLLSPSPLGRNLFFFDDTGCSSARTRSLERKAHRRIVRKQQYSRCHGDRQNNVTVTGVDPSSHPLLSLPHELPSRVLLDAAVQRVLSEHSYAQLPLNKRRKAAAKLPHISTPRTIIIPPRAHCDHTSFSKSPSPIGTPLSASSDRAKGSGRKRPSLVHQSSSSCDTSSPWSPGMFRPHTPVLNTPSHPVPKKRRLMSSTPSFDIDNIVIPYSMASTTRVEKLEYKEIITPSWREVGGKKTAETEVIKQHRKGDSKLPESAATEKERGKDHPTNSTEAPPTDLTPSPDSDREEEDISDEAYSRRHEKCESIEKQKFLNFITGGSRKRTRPQSLASTPDASTAWASSPHPLASTVASSSKGKQKRVLLSPTPSEVELATIRAEAAAVQPWTPREFPLNEADLDALVNPPPPPRLVTITPSPSPMETRSSTPTDFKPSCTPSTTSTAVATPISSPVSTPSEETPAISPAEWTVQFNNTQFGHTTKTSHFPSLVLRLSKRTV